MPRTESGWRRLFLSAALFNWAAVGILAAAQYASFAALGIVRLPAPGLWFDLTLVAVGSFGYGYYRVSRDLRQTALVELGMVAKLLVVGAITWHWIAGHASWHLVALVTIDLVYVFFFLEFLGDHGRGATTATRLADRG